MRSISRVWNLLIYKKARKTRNPFYFNLNLIILLTLENNEFRMIDNNLNLIFLGVLKN